MRATSSRSKQRESAAKYAHRGRNRETAKQRWRQEGERCEGCGIQVNVVEFHHTFGKGKSAQVEGRDAYGEPWCDHPALLSPLCCARTWNLAHEGCHEIVTNERDPKLRDRLRLVALQRFALANRVGGSPWPPKDLIGELRGYIQVIEGRSEDR